MGPFGRGQNAHGIYHNSDAMHSNAAFAALAFVNQFRYTRNITFLQHTSYPYLRGLAAWFTYWFTKVSLPRCAIHMLTVCWMEVPISGSGNQSYQYIIQNDCTAENCFGGAPPYGVFGCIQSLPHPGPATANKVICTHSGDGPRPACCGPNATDVNTAGTSAFSRFVLQHLIEVCCFLGLVLITQSLLSVCFVCRR